MSNNFIKLLRAGKIHDDVQKGIFSITFNSHVAQVEYEKIGDTYDLIHSSIPDDLQGHGLGSVLAERVFDHLITKGNKIKLTCEFLESFYLKNSEKYKKFVVDK